MSAVLVTLLDILLGGVILLTFCFFHHVRPRLWPDSVDDTGKVFTKAPPDSGRTDAYTGSLTRPNIPENSGPPLSSGGASDTDTVQTAGSFGPSTPEYDTSGDFGAKFAPLFAQDDRIYQDSTTYQSHDVYMTLRTFDGEAEQLTKRGGSSYSKEHVIYHVMDIYVRNIENLFCSYNQNRAEKAETLYGDSTFGSAAAAISGDLFVGYAQDKNVIVRNGKVIRMGDYITNDICVLYYDGTMETITPDEYDREAIEAKVPYQIWCFGPELLDNGKIKADMKTAVWPKNPRAALGYVEPGHYVLVCVDGCRGDDDPAAHGVGANMDFLAQIMAEAGCKLAYNLDGGASVYAYWGDDRLVAINGGSRPISDLICVGEVAS